MPRTQEDRRFRALNSVHKFARTEVKALIKARVNPPKPISADCEDPYCPGWLAMSDSCGNGPAIERCDMCRCFDSDDSARDAAIETFKRIVRGTEQ